MRTHIFLLTFFIAINSQAMPCDTSRWANSATRLNTAAKESHPLLSADGQTMYFVRTNHAQNIGEDDKADIWVSFRDTMGNWSNSVNIGAPLNNDNDNKIVGVNLSNDIVYLTGDANNRVFYSKYKNRTWSQPKELTISGIANAHPQLNCHISLDERFFLFCLQNDSCVGKRDLFMSSKEFDGSWSAPKSLGKLLNTAGDEANVFLAADNRTLYFATDGRDGNGGIDWYVTRRLDDTWLKWSAPQNLGEKVNSPDDDLFFCVNMELEECYGIRANNYSNDTDISRFIIEDPILLPLRTILVYGKVVNPSGEPEQTTIDVQYLNQEMPNQTIYSKADGTFQVLLSENDRVGFYANGKNVFSALAYVNLTEMPLKMLDADSIHVNNEKDSLHLLNSEKLQIRINQLNDKITILDKNVAFSNNFDFLNSGSFFKTNNNYEQNIALEKLYEAYKQKYGVAGHSSNAHASIPSSYENYKNTLPNIDELGQEFSKEDTLNRLARMKQTFSEKKRNKETTGSNEQLGNKETNKPNDYLLDHHEERLAIEAVKDLHGINEQRVPAFEAYLAAVQQSIIKAEWLSIKEDLEKESIEDWNNWQNLHFTPEEERKLNQKLDEIKKNLRKQVEERNKIEKQHSEAHLSKNEVKNISKEAKDVVINGLRSAAKEPIRLKIDTILSLYLHDELRAIHRKSLEKEKILLSKHKKSVGQYYSEQNTLKLEQSKYLNLKIFKLSKNQTIPLNGLFFKPNSAELLPESNTELSRIHRIIEETSFRIIELSAHTHGYTSPLFADNITRQRLQVIKDELLRRGVPAANILTHAYGKNAPLAPNNQIEGRVLNQRIDMKIIAE
jgi:outer membrane protein OmpA-like peptidoglycan-associated protein